MQNLIAKYIFRLCILSLLLTTTPAVHAESWPKIDEPPQDGDQNSELDAAVIIGINDYIFAPDIAGADENASAWFRYLVEGRGLPVERAALLRNTEGTREKILRALKTKAAEVKPGGTLWIVFVGHGAPSPDTQEGVLVGVDAQQEADGLFARSISQSEVLSAIKDGQQAKTVLLIDACFSGRSPDGQPLAPGLQPLILVDENKNKIPDNLLIFTAGQSDQFAGPLPGLKRPAFSYLMLGALRGWADQNADDQVSAQEALEYTRLTLSASVKDRTQTPTLRAQNVAAVLSSPATEAPPDLSKILSGQESSSGGTRVNLGGNGVIRLEAKDDGEYNLSVLTGDGSEYVCDAPATKKTPCTLKNLPQGRIVLRISGDMEREEITTLGNETIVLNADGAAGWYGWTSIGCAVGGFVASIVFVTAGISSADENEDGLNALTITGIALTPILWTTSLVFGVLWFLDDDKFSSQRFDAPRANDDNGISLDWGVAATGDGGMVGLQLTW